MTSGARVLMSWVIVSALLFAGTPLAHAQVSSGISGIVKDTSGAVLPGVTVEVSSPVLIEGSRTTVTDGSGHYQIIDLRPGLYDVSFQLPGFSTVRREGIELTGALTATVSVELRVGGVQETITVPGSTPLVDTQSVRRQGRHPGHSADDGLRRHGRPRQRRAHAGGWPQHRRRA